MLLMSVRRRILFLAILLMLAARAGAQHRPEAAPHPAPPAPTQQVMTLRVTLPTAVGYAMRLFSKDEQEDKATAAAKKEERTSNPVLVFTVPVPQLLGGKKAEPATPQKD